MTITRYSKTPAGGGILRRRNKQTSCSLEKGLNNNILLRSVTYVIMSPDTDKPMAQAVKNSTPIHYWKYIQKIRLERIIRVT
jgi:hypothetical protein